MLKFKALSPRSKLKECSDISREQYIKHQQLTEPVDKPECLNFYEKQLFIKSYHLKQKIITAFMSATEYKFTEYARKMSSCCSNITLQELLNKRSKQRYTKFKDANFCHVSSCPLCMYGTARRLLAQSKTAIELLSDYSVEGHLFNARLPGKIVAIDKLKSGIGLINEAFKSLLKKQKNKEVVLKNIGYLKFLGIKKIDQHQALPYVDVLFQAHHDFPNTEQLQLLWSKSIQEAGAAAMLNPATSIKRFLMQSLGNQINVDNKIDHYFLENKIRDDWFLQYVTQWKGVNGHNKSGILSQAFKESEDRYKARKNGEQNGTGQGSDNENSSIIINCYDVNIADLAKVSRQNRNM